MKQVIYYCDICKQRVKNSKAELDCTSIEIDFVHNWEQDMPIARKVCDLRVCKQCGEKVDQFIKSITVGGNPNAQEN